MKPRARTRLEGLVSVVAGVGGVAAWCCMHWLFVCRAGRADRERRRGGGSLDEDINLFWSLEKGWGCVSMSLKTQN